MLIPLRATVRRALCHVLGPCQVLYSYAVEQGTDKSFDLVMHYPTRRLESMSETLADAGVGASSVVFVATR